MREQLLLDMEHPVLKNHKAYGQELLPGLAYIDMLYQIFRERGFNFKELELRNLSIYYPMTVECGYSILLDIRCTEAKTDLWSIDIYGSKKKDDGSISEKKLYVHAEMHRIIPKTYDGEKIDFGELKAQSVKHWSLEEVYGKCRLQELVHYGYMKADGTVYATEQDILMDISAGQEASVDADDAMFHPVLIDGSAVGSMTMFSKIVEEEHRLFLPLYYESFYAAELLQKRCLTRIKKESLQRKKDLLYMTIEFFNEDGNKVGELKNFANKLVRSANLINSNMEYEQLKQDKLEMEDSENIFSESGNNSEDDVINDIESFLKQLMAEQLEVSADCIDTQAGYYEMGLDSPGLLRIVSSIEEKVDEILPPTLLFEYTTIKELSEYLVERYGSRFIHSNEANDEELNNNSVTAKIEKKPIFQEELKECEEIKGSQIQDIAVIGMSGRYPQAENIQEFWENLFNGRDCITEIPKSRWDYHCLDGLKSNSGKSMSKWGGFIKEPDRFDAKFFRVSPRDAETMDPQERLFLEVCWETIEDSGYTPKNLVIPKGANNRRDVGVFVGVMHKDYTMIESDAVLKGQVLPVSFSHAQIANRVSYFCNFNGPSIAVDTVCSSSLTAVHLAMESINHDECEVAIAGGVNLSLHPNKYMTYGMMDMQSSEGRCRAFGEGGDGYVSADGVAAILLKPLKKAIEDNDHIYAVIKGSAINHVGTVSGITVPSPVAQGEVIDACLKKTGIDPRTISYVEAHGTGTSLGDPIEIEGLVRAYKNYTSDHQYCSIGSVKSNIGHAESAAGVIGLQKVVLQLYYKTLVKSLHSEKLNSYIDFEKSPFYVQRKTEEWKTPTIVTNGKEIPVKRRAGLSSFGASGSNVHLILEEYISDDFHTRDSIEADNQENLVLVPLSAKNKDRLLEYAKKLLDFITVKELSLRQLAYTFQTGREAMEVRVAFLSSSIFELKEKIKAFITGNDLPEDCWLGEIKNKKSKKEKSDKGLTPITAKNLITLKQRLKEMAELWINGESVNWELLYGEGKPRKISLPTYPFANEHYWIPIVDSEAKNILGNKKATEWLHPLLQKNTSDFSEQRFSTTFTGDEIFLLDHMINGQKHLPGVAHLEMVREAVKLSVGADKLIGTEMRIKDVVWIRPVVVEQPVTVNIGLYPGENEEISFEIYQDLEEDGKELIVYSQGYVLLEQQTGEEPSIDIASVEAKCKEMTVSGAQCYEAFKDVGFEYGPSHNGIEELLVGDGQVVGKLSLAPELFGFVNEYMLHPGITDSALQASIGLILRNGNFTSLVPFALDEVRILKSCTNKMRALIKYAYSNKEEKQLRKLNIDLYDMQGMLCVSIKGLSTKAIEMNASGLNIDKTHGSMLLKPKWVEKTACLDEVSFKKRIVMLCAPFDSAKKSIKQKINGVRCFTFSDNFEDAATAFTDFSMKVFENIQSILLEKPLDKLLIQIIIPNCGEKQIFSGLSGLLKTATLENPNLVGQILELNPQEETDALIEKLEDSSKISKYSRIRYVGDRCLVCNWSEIDKVDDKEIPWKDNGVYLISGGAGGLGLIFAEEIVQKVKGAVLVLTGRSTLTSEKSGRLKGLEINGNKIIYKQVDVSDKVAVSILVKEMLDTYGAINGIIHSAGIVKDNFIVKKPKEEFLEVLAPKVAGVVNLDLSTKDVALDFFIIFSSGAAVVGNPGQADYSAANAFLDAYAEYREILVDLDQRSGKTLSINWPLWENGGMKVDEESEKLMMSRLGITPMLTSTGINALYQCISSGEVQVMVVEGLLKRMRQKLISSDETSDVFPKTMTNSANRNNNESESVHKKLSEGLVQIICKVLKVQEKDIDNNSDLNDYGFDSITWTEFANRLNQEYELDINPTLFFEYSTVNSLCDYLIKEFPSNFTYMTQQQDLKAKEEKVDEETVPTTINMAAKKRNNSRFVKHTTNKVVAKDFEQDPIAVVGMSGSFPMAKDLEEFWENLKTGRDCISEVPSLRWDWKILYGDPVKERNKSNIKWGGFIDGVDQFDPLFFGISPREAEFMDPQQRLLMMHVWKTIEDAGYSAKKLSGTKTGIFVGTADTGYSRLFSYEDTAIEGYSATGIVPSIGPNRMSYFLNLHGPSEAIETACSSSLVAINRAISAMRDGTCDMAIVGGVNTLVNPDFHISFNKAGMLCEDGRCKTFSDKANGYVRGEGVGMLLLKRLSEAEKDGDHIYGLIRGSAENHGGHANSLTSPNPKAQADLLVTAYKKVGFDPRTITYIEAHGTGTELGDPIEINALKAAFKELYQDYGISHIEERHCGLGSVKTNIGHLELSSGIAGVIKVLLQLKHKTLVKSLHCETVNPYIKLEDSPFYIVQEAKNWETCKDESGNDIPRRAGVSSFGFGGVNVHIVLEEYIPRKTVRTTASNQNPVAIVISAKNEARLREYVELLLSHISKNNLTDADLRDLAYTLQIGREAFDERLGVIVSSIQELKDKLKGFLENKEKISDLYYGQAKRNKDLLSIFSSDDEFQETIDKWLHNRKYTKLLEIWVRGLWVDWDKLYVNEKPTRMSLPTYPFAKEKYWVPKGKSKKFDINPVELSQNSIKEEVDFKQASVKTVERQIVNTLEIGTETEFFTKTLEKPKGISLINLSPDMEKAYVKDVGNHLDIKVSAEESKHSEAETALSAESDKKKIISGQALEEYLLESLAEVLNLSQGDIDPHEKFIDMGVDSITGVNWVQAIGQKYGITIRATKIYDYPSIKEFAKYLEKELYKNDLIVSGKDNSFTTPDKSTYTSLQNPVKEEAMYTQPESETSGEVLESQKAISVDIEALQASLAACLADVLNIDENQIDVSEKFVDMGLDSITGVNWVGLINQQYGTSIKATKVYDYPNILEFSTFLQKEIEKMGQTPNPVLHLSADEILMKVQSGLMNIEQAEELLTRLGYEE